VPVLSATVCPKNVPPYNSFGKLCLILYFVSEKTISLQPLLFRVKEFNPAEAEKLIGP